MKRIFDPENVLAHIQANIGTRYTAANLAKAFKVQPALMRELLTELLAIKKIETSTGTSRFYFIPKPAVDPLTSYRYSRPFKPLVLKSDFGERRKELYPEGYSLSMNGGKS
jgi:uncharacterized protein YaiL (DUF2058 family)